MRGLYLNSEVALVVVHETARLLAIAAEFQPDVLVDVSRRLGEAGLSIQAVAADASGLRIFPANVDEAKRVLTDAGYFAQVVEVIRIDVTDGAGVLHDVMQRLAGAHIQILSAFGMGIKDAGAIYVRVDDLRAALAALDE